MEILSNAANPHLKTILYIDLEEANDLLKDNIKLTTPCSLPGKLPACLFQRFKHSMASLVRAFQL